MKYKGKKIKLVSRFNTDVELHGCVGCVIYEPPYDNDDINNKYYRKCIKDSKFNMFIYEEDEKEKSADSVSQNETVDEQLK